MKSKHLKRFVCRLRGVLEPPDQEKKESRNGRRRSRCALTGALFSSNREWENLFSPGMNSNPYGAIVAFNASANRPS